MTAYDSSITIIFVGKHNPETRRKYVRERRKQLRDAWIAENGPCKQCGGTDRLQIDHINPLDKNHQISSNLWMWGKEKRELELAKCQVLCTPCHVIKTRPSIISASKRRIGIPCPKPTEMVKLTCVECGREFDKPARKERYAVKNRRLGPFCSPGCKGIAAARERWNLNSGDQPRS